jgi:predicted PurR-regulated permease PerM
MTDDSSSTHEDDRTSPLRTLERGQQAPRGVQPRQPVPAPLQTLAGYSWRFLVIVGAAAVIVYLVIHLRLVVLPLVAALFLSTFLYPLVERLRGRGFKPAAAAGTVLAGALLFLALFIGVLAPQVGEEVGDMGQAVRQGTEQILSLVARPPLNISQDQVDTFVNRAFEQIQGIEKGSPAV